MYPRKSVDPAGKELPECECWKKGKRERHRDDGSGSIILV